MEVQLVTVTSGPLQAPALTVPDTQMGQTVNMPVSGPEEGNSLI